MSKAVLVRLCSRLLVVGFLVILTAGCHKQPASPIPPAPAQTSTESAPSAEPQQSTPQSPTVAAPDEAQVAATLNELTQAVRRFGAEQRRVPKSLEEVAARGYLSAVPPAPAGKKYAIDKNLQVRLTP
jgi:hypothetical protein